MPNLDEDDLFVLNLLPDPPDEPVPARRQASTRPAPAPRKPRKTLEPKEQVPIDPAARPPRSWKPSMQIGTSPTRTGCPATTDGRSSVPNAGHPACASLPSTTATKSD